MAEDVSTVKGINHVGLSVHDLDRAVSFYTSVMPLELADRCMVGGGPGSLGIDSMSTEPLDVALLRGPNAYLELLEVAPAQSGETTPLAVEGPGLTHVCFQSPEHAQLYSRFIEQGATAVSSDDAPIDLNGVGVRYGYARDIDGIMFEVEQLDEPRFGDPIWIAHVALVSPDIDRLVDFYQDVLGVAPYGRVNKVTGPRVDQVTGLDGARIRAAWFNAGNMVLELWEYIVPATPEPTEPRAFAAPGYNRFVFEVADFDREVERLSGHGVEFVTEPAEVDGSREIYAKDPDGNLFGLLQLPVDSDMSLDRLERIDWM
jgi:catechol 2,3-dioxygenase-like lactoylglutathione lyase family enzyme